MSNHAVLSASAARSRTRTDEERAFDQLVQSVKLKPEGHTQQPLPESHVERLKVAKGLEGQRFYTVTTLASSARYGGTRTWLVCSTFERARKIVEENIGDIFEASYQLAVIEATVCDWLYCVLPEQYWYVWKGDYQTGGYKPIEIPEKYRDTINIGIG